MNGYFNQLLVVDLSNRKHWTQSIEDSLLQRCLGGKGLGAYLLLENNPAGIDPFDPANHLILALGPATDTPIYGSCRHGIFSKSPLTGFFAESYSGGSLAIPLSRTGNDAIMIIGAAERPTWLEITDQDVIFHDGANLWGMDTHATEAALRQRLDEKNSSVMVIGPAGENRVRFAVVKNDGWRVAGRTGMGAVFGSKNLKAIAFHGNQHRSVDQPEALKAYARDMLKNLKDHAATVAYRGMGTPMMVDLLNNAGGFPTRYWSAGTFEQRDKINAASLKQRCNARPKACRTCFLACGNQVEVQHGRHKGLKLEGPEYETIYAFGGLCMIDSIEEIIYLNDLCDRMGMDTITSGNLAAFAIEAARIGKIDAPLAYGQPDMVADLLKKIVKREGLGGLLAEGIRPASEELGMTDVAVHVKGMEPPGYDPRALKGMGLAYAVSDRGACHLRSTFYKPELVGMSDPQVVDDQKVKLFLDFEDRCTLMDCLIVCRFYRDFYMWTELSDLFALTTGVRLDQSQLQRAAAGATNAARRFNLREGLTMADDRLPRRLLNNALPDHRTITGDEMDMMVNRYYRLRGWDRYGIPAQTDE